MNAYAPYVTLVTVGTVVTVVTVVIVVTVITVVTVVTKKNFTKKMFSPENFFLTKKPFSPKVTQPLHTKNHATSSHTKTSQESQNAALRTLHRWSNVSNCTFQKK